MKNRKRKRSLTDNTENNESNSSPVLFLSPKKSFFPIETDGMKKTTDLDSHCNKKQKMTVQTVQVNGIDGSFGLTFVHVPANEVTPGHCRSLGENVLSSGTLATVCHYAQCVLELINVLFFKNRRVGSLFAAAWNRPPGHHCFHCISGFCVVNMAVLAIILLWKMNDQWKIGLLDVDAHFGDGTMCFLVQEFKKNPKRRQFLQFASSPKSEIPLNISL
jgi:hypothetical protein